MPPVTEYHIQEEEEVTSQPLSVGHIYTDHVHPWEEIVEYVCKFLSLSLLSAKHVS